MLLNRLKRNYKPLLFYVSVSFYLELLQGAQPGVEAVLRQAAGQKVDPRLFWSLSVHLFRIYIQVLQEEEEE